MGYNRYLTAKDIVEGSPNLNLAFVAHIFQHRNGLSTREKPESLLEISPDDAQITREESTFRFWINSLGVATYINNVFEDVRNGSMMRLNLLSDPLLFAIYTTQLSDPLCMSFCLCMHTESSRTKSKTRAIISRNIFKQVQESSTEIMVQSLLHYLEDVRIMNII